VRNAIAEAASEASGRLDGLVNAAGVVAFGSLAEHDDDTIEDSSSRTRWAVVAGTGGSPSAAGE